jgi:AbrB family looped-hinge helix DNA binding protein
MSVTTITAKGQITLPAEFRKRDGFHPGDKVVVREGDGMLIVEPVTAPVERLKGMLADLWVGKAPVTIEEMDEAAAAGWADEPIVKKTND